jgi:competence protein ComEC
MVNRLSLTPVVYTAVSAAFGFYFLSRLYHSGHVSLAGFYLLLLVPLAVVCFFNVLALYSDHHPVKLLARYSFASIVGLAIGIGAGGNALARFDVGLPVENISGVSGVLSEDPRTVSGGRAMAVLRLTEVSTDRGLRAGARGEIPVLFPDENSGRLREFGRKCSIFTTGKIYQGSGGMIFIADSLHITHPAPRLENFRSNINNSLKQRFTSDANRNNASWGALSLALLLGVRDNLDSNFAGLFRDAGCSHILALSGMHLAIIAAMIALILKKPLGQNSAAIAGSFIIVLYCVLVGPMPSLYRAALMYLLGVVTIVGSLKRNVLSILSMAFVIQIIASPADGNSISFILSYLALLGILTIGESVNYICRGKIPSVLLGSLSASAGAFLLTAGVSAYYFSLLRPVGIISSLVLTPLTTVFMAGSIVWLILDVISPFLSGIIGPVLSLLYRLMEKTVVVSAYAPPLTAGFWLVLTVSLAFSVLIIWYAQRRRVYRNRMPAFG